MTGARTRQLALGWRDLTLAGTLHGPEAEGPHPAMLMMQGSGPSDRDGNGYFPPIRGALVARGVAVYSFDKPGCGRSTGDWRNHGLEDRVDQAVEALRVLRADAAVDHDRVGIWGQSQGGWLVQMLAGREDDLAFAVANSGPTLPPAEQDLHGCEHTMRAGGRSASDIEHALEYVRRIHRAARDGADFAAVEAGLLASARSEPWYGYLTVEDPLDWELIKEIVGTDFDPVEALTRVRCPFLAIFGGLDDLLPAWRCAREAGEAMIQAPSRDVTVVVFPPADHRITSRRTGELVDGYLDLLGDWVARRVGTACSTT